MTQSGSARLPQSRADGRCAFTLIELLVVIAIIVVLCGLLGDTGQTMFAFLAGWFLHLKRLSSELVVDWDATVTAGVSLILLLLGIHVFGRTWRRQRGDAAATPWRWSWSIAMTLGVVCLAGAGIAAVGVAHQSFWLATGPAVYDTSGTGRQAAERLHSTNSLREVVMAAHSHQQHLKALPPGVLLSDTGDALHGWGTLLLPYLEFHAPLAKKIRLDRGWLHPDNRPLFGEPVAPFLNRTIAEQTNDGFGLSHYAANVHAFGAAPRRLPDDFPDGTSNTLALGEAGGAFRPWGHPFNWRDPALGLNRAPEGFGHPRRKVVLFARADGAVLSLREQISPAVLKALATPSGGETVPAEAWD